ncbi:hypothetical protein [Bifidobacterium bifidum]|uniref:hypothetical protein n=1 Tax=Bifidobacterium bifidum TaxID=1681 RepID=UPI001E504500|nr:hypothetical protein [Bifidobacterium bifidum]MDK7285177.1 hypothetical protein [Bifidobacterium bifidum]
MCRFVFLTMPQRGQVWDVYAGSISMTVWAARRALYSIICRSWKNARLTCT